MKHLRFTLLLALLTAFPPLATDMYLPALPFLKVLWGASLSVINLTLVLFFAVYCISLLFYGPLSDRWGRRRPLLWGISIFIGGSVLCALSHNVGTLIAARMLQAFGAASASAISMAMTKDRLEGKERERVMGYVAVIMTLAPMASPMVGSLILKWAAWPHIFVLQAILGSAAFIGVFFTPETNGCLKKVGIKKLMGSYARVCQNRNFMGIVVCTSLVGLPFFAFIASSSSIYISQYHLSASMFSLFFGGNSLCFMLGAIVCARLGTRFESEAFIFLGFLGMAFGGAVMSLGLFPAHWSLALPMGWISFFLGLSRPPANNIALDQVKEDSGSASSLLVFTYFITGALGMALVSFEWASNVHVIGVISTIIGIFLTFFWMRFRKKLADSDNPAMVTIT